MSILLTHLYSVCSNQVQYPNHPNGHLFYNPQKFHRKKSNVIKMLSLDVKIWAILHPYYKIFQVHRGILCQYCLKLFKKVRDLDSHLAGVHKVQSRYYHSSAQLAKYSGTSYSFICSGCSEMVEFGELDAHVCGVRSSYDCPWCRETQASQADLESHIVNEWCPRSGK